MYTTRLNQYKYMIKQLAEKMCTLNKLKPTSFIVRRYLYLNAKCYLSEQERRLAVKEKKIILTYYFGLDKYTMSKFMYKHKTLKYNLNVK